MRSLPALAVALLAFGCLAPAAAASTAELYQPPFSIPDDDSCRPGLCDPPPPVIRVNGEPGETNAFAIARDDDSLVIRDTGAALKAGNRCAADPDGAVRCPLARFALKAGDGDDRVTVATEASGTADGGPGNDVLTGPAHGTLIDSLSGGDGNDTISGSGALDGGAGDDALTGTERDETITPGPGVDRVAAGAGDDQIADERTPAADVLDGGDGFDLIAFTGRPTPVSVDLSPTSQRAGSAGEGNQLSGLELATGGGGEDAIALAIPVPPPEPPNVSRGLLTVTLGRGDDRLTLGAEIAVRVEGGPGDDVIAGSPGADELDGGTGADRIDGAGGDDEVGDGFDFVRDVLRGGAGDDRVVSGSAKRGRGDVVDGGPGRDSVEGGEGPDRLFGRSGDDELRGDAGADVADGGPGRDRVYGGAGRDLVRGGPGADRLFGEGFGYATPGSPAVDRLFGGAGNDRISAVDRRADRIHCGAGRDTLRADARDRSMRCERVRGPD
jgi:Ca2+-binding RTX toxin-like protein